MATAEIGPLHRHLPAEEPGDAEALAVALAEAVAAIAKAERPVILAGEELHRFGLQAKLADIVHKTGMPVAATITGKSVFPESDPAYLGIYEGAMGRDSVRDYVEKSDCLVLLGAQMTDMNLGVYTARIDRRYAIYAASDRIAIGHHSFDGVGMADFVAGLAAHSWLPRSVPPFEHPEHPGLFNPADRAMTVEALFRQVNAFLDDDMVVIADTGDSLFGAEDLYIHNSVHFLAAAYYCSLGFAVPAALGVKAAKPHLRPLVLVGDGAFQMTGMEVRDARPLRPEPDHRRARQQRLWHRTADARRRLQRRGDLALLEDSGGPRHRPRHPRHHGDRNGCGAETGARQHRRGVDHPGDARPQRPLAGAPAPHRDARRARPRQGVKQRGGALAQNRAGGMFPPARKGTKSAGGR